MNRKSIRGLSGVIAAIMVMAVLTAGILATTYVSNTYSSQNRHMLDELRRQAAKNQELIRIYIHAQNSSDIESPARITIVNAWGFTSNITKLLAILRQTNPGDEGPTPPGRRMFRESDDPPIYVEGGGEAGQTGGAGSTTGVEIREIARQIIVPPGSRVTLTPQDLGLDFTSFRQLADSLSALIAYTDAGNSFGNTWGYPRDDNLLGATTATTYNTTTIEVWQVPSISTVNNTFYMNRTISLNPPAPITYSRIQAVNHFEKINILARGVRTSWDGNIYYSASVTGLPEDGSPSAPLPDWRNAISVRTNIDSGNGWFYSLWAWEPAAGWADALDNTKTVYVEKGSYYTNVNAPRSLVISINIASLGSTCTVVYSLRRVDVQPSPPNYPAPTTTYIRQGYYVSMTHHPTTYGAKVYPAGPALTFNNYYQGTFTANLLYSGTRFVRPGDNPNWPVYMMVTTRTASVITAYGVRAYGVTWSAWQAWISALPTYTVGPENPVYVSHFQVTEDSYTVHRYYYVDKVECNIYTPSPQAPRGASYTTDGTCGPGQSCVTDLPPTCDVYAVTVTTPVTGGGSGSGGGSSGGGFVSIVKYLINCPPRLPR